MCPKDNWEYNFPKEIFFKLYKVTMYSNDRHERILVQKYVVDTDASKAVLQCGIRYYRLNTSSEVGVEEIRLDKRKILL